EDLHEAALEQHLECRPRIDTADLFDFRPCQRLAVGANRQGLELRAREAHRLGLEDLPYERGVHRRRAKLIPSGQLHELDAASAILFDELSEQANDVLGARTCDAGQPLRRNWLVGDEYQAFEDGLEVRLPHGLRLRFLEARALGTVLPQKLTLTFLG